MKIFLEMLAGALFLICPVGFFLAWRNWREERMAEARADLSDAVLDEESASPLLRLQGRLSWAKPMPCSSQRERAMVISQAEREILWAVTELGKSTPEAEPVWINALRIGGKRLERLRSAALATTGAHSAARPPRAACTEASPPSHP